MPLSYTLPGLQKCSVRPGQLSQGLAGLLGNLICRSISGSTILPRVYHSIIMMTVLA
jgi:hypothetical protein